MGRTKTAEYALLQYESGQDLVEMAAMTDSGDHLTYGAASAPWSGYEGKEPEVYPDGVDTGLELSEAASGSNDVIDLAGGTAYLAGVKKTVVAAADVAVPRANAAHIIVSLAALNYVNAIAGDIGKKVTGGTTTDTGNLVSYDNVARKWLVLQDDADDLFDDANEVISIAVGGTGAGKTDAIAVECTHKINSVTINSAGAVAVVEGFSGITAFSTTRGALAGPPFIPVGSAECGQVRYTSATPAAVAESEIKQVVGTHREDSASPVFDEDWQEGEITFVTANPLIHTGATARKVYAEYYTPTFAEVSNASDFVPAETTHSLSSTQIYGGNVGASSSSINQASFNCRLQKGVGDAILRVRDRTLWFRFYPDKYRAEYIMTQGKFGVSRTFPAGDHIQAACTISASVASTDN